MLPRCRSLTGSAIAQLTPVPMRGLLDVSDQPVEARPAACTGRAGSGGTDVTAGRCSRSTMLGTSSSRSGRRTTFSPTMTGVSSQRVLGSRSSSRCRLAIQASGYSPRWLSQRRTVPPNVKPAFHATRRDADVAPVRQPDDCLEVAGLETPVQQQADRSGHDPAAADRRVGAERELGASAALVAQRDACRCSGAAARVGGLDGEPVLGLRLPPLRASISPTNVPRVVQRCSPGGPSSIGWMSGRCSARRPRRRRRVGGRAG